MKRMNKRSAHRNLMVLCLMAGLMILAAVPAGAASKKTVYVISKLTLKYDGQSHSNSQNFSYNSNGLVTGYKGSIEIAKIPNTSSAKGTFFYSEKNNTSRTELRAESGLTSYYTYTWKKGKVKTGSSVLTGGMFSHTYASNKKKKVTSVKTTGGYSNQSLLFGYDSKGRLSSISKDTKTNAIYTISYDKKGYPKKIAGAPGYYSMTLANTYKNKQLSKITGTPDNGGLGWTCSVKLKKMSVPSDYAAVITGQQRQILLTYVCRLPLETVPMGGI